MLVLLAFPATALANDAVKETVGQVERAFKSGNLIEVKAALSRAESLRKFHHDRTFAPVAKAVGRGVRHADRRVALAAVETLGALGCKETAHFLAPLLKVPASFETAAMRLYLAAIRAAAAIQDPSSLPALRKLLGHGWTEIAVEAASALGRFRFLDDRPRAALVRRLLPTLAKLERTESKTRKETERIHAAALRRALVASVRQLTGVRKLKTSRDGYAWLKQPRGL